MNFCGACGARTGGGRYCPSCGAPREGTSRDPHRLPMDAGTCRVCSMPVAARVKRCPRCGAKDPLLSNRTRLYLFLAVAAAAIALTIYSNLDGTDSSESLSSSSRPLPTAPATPASTSPTPVPTAAQPARSPASAIAPSDDDPAQGGCSRASSAVLGRIESRPAKGMGDIVVPSGYVVQGEYGQVIGGFLTSEDSTVPVDGEFGAWFLQPDGSLFSYYGSAIHYTSWPQIGEGAITQRIEQARTCAEANAG
jgi:hypothetical protein